MRRVLLSICLLIATAAPAYAQGSWRMNPSLGGLFSSDLNVDADWVRCTNDNHEFSFERAIESCTRIIDDLGAGRWEVGGALWYRANLYFDQQQHELANADLQQALGIYDELIEANRRDPDGYNNRASINKRLENYDAAIADYDLAISLNNDTPSPHIGRAQVLFRRGDYTGAIEAYDRASRIAARQYGTNASIYGGKCAARAAARTDLENARRFCDRAVRNSNGSAWALSTRGYLHVIRDDLEAAAADFTRAVERDQYYAPALYGRGAVAVRQGRQAEGEADMTRALEMSRWQVEYYANAGLRP